MMATDRLGDRMKQYEQVTRDNLIRRVPVILRLDGRAFHTLTRGCQKPFDSAFILSMIDTAASMLGEIQGAKCAYVQSDEISILITDYDSMESGAWFDYNIQKIASITAGIASVAFTQSFGRNAVFDARVFNLPRQEVVNYFVWRQKDWNRNSVQMLARANFSHKALQNQGIPEIHDMLCGVGVNWNDLKPGLKNGYLIKKSVGGDGKSRWVCYDAPTFTEDRAVINDLLVGFFDDPSPGDESPGEG